VTSPKMGTKVHSKCSPHASEVTHTEGDFNPYSRRRLRHPSKIAARVVSLRF
jgi:hypothetical protein